MPRGLPVKQQALPWLAAVAVLTSGCAMPDRYNDAGSDEAGSVEYMMLIPDDELRSRAPDPDEFADMTVDG